MILAVPEACTHVLGVKVIGSEHVGGRFAEGFQRSSQAGYLRGLSVRTASPVVTQKAVVEVVGKVRSDVRGDTGGQIPGHLRTRGQRSRHTEFISGKEAAYVYLVRGGTLHFIVTVSGVEMTLGSENLHQANHSKVVIPNERHVGFKFQHIQTITTAKTAARSCIRLRHKLPQCLKRGTDSQAPRVKRSARTGVRRTGYQRSDGGCTRGGRGRRGVQIEDGSDRGRTIGRLASGVAHGHLQQSQPQTI